jgi:hypothetical protein
VSEKHLGYFFETGPNIKLMSIATGAEIPRGTAQGHRAVFLTQGELEFNGETFAPTSYFMLPSGEGYATFRARKDTEMLVIGWSDSEPVPFSLL